MKHLKKVLFGSITIGGLISLVYVLGIQGLVTAGGPQYCHGYRATIIGTPGDDVITGTNGVLDVILALEGNDAIDGLGGTNIICGGPGDDSITGGSGADFLWGDEGADFLVGQEGTDVIRGGPGNDFISGGAGLDYLFGEDDTAFRYPNPYQDLVAQRGGE